RAGRRQRQSAHYWLRARPLPRMKVPSTRAGFAELAPLPHGRAHPSLGRRSVMFRSRSPFARTALALLAVAGLAVATGAVRSDEEQIADIEKKIADLNKKLAELKAAPTSISTAAAPDGAIPDASMNPLNCPCIP